MPIKDQFAQPATPKEAADEMLLALVNRSVHGEEGVYAALTDAINRVIAHQFPDCEKDDQFIQDLSDKDLLTDTMSDAIFGGWAARSRCGFLVGLAVGQRLAPQDVSYVAAIAGDPAVRAYLALPSEEQIAIRKFIQSRTPNGELTTVLQKSNKAARHAAAA